MTLFSLSKTPPDILYLYGARALRGFGDGFAIIILPVYLSAIGFSPQQIGIVASASLLGTAAVTLIVGFIAPRHQLRSLFLAGAGLIAFTGLIFPATETIAPVLVVAFIGSINPSGGDLGMLVPLEHALLTRETADKDRTGIFARYSLIGALTAAADSRPKSALGPSRNIVYKLAALFSVDAFAGGFVVQSLLALWLFQKFNLSLEAASLFFFCSSLLGAMSFPVAAWLSRRVGLVNTMVFTDRKSVV